MLPNCDPVVMGRRQSFLTALYEADGRDDRDHPHHATYTGLLDQWKRYAHLSGQWLDQLAVDDSLRAKHPESASDCV